MSGSKRIVVNLSEKVFDDFNAALEKDSKKKSEFIREAIILYIKERKKFDISSQMQKGYTEMAELNLEISEMGMKCDIGELSEYEVKLSESDFQSDDNSEKRRYILC